MNTVKVKEGCSREQKQIITEYFSGVSFKSLVKSEITGKENVMTKGMVEEKIYKALSYIEWD